MIHEQAQRREHAQGRRVEAAAIAAGILAAVAISVGSLAAAVVYQGTAGEAYSPLNHWISELGQIGVSSAAPLFNACLILAGILFGCFVAGLWLSSRSRLRWLFGPVGMLAAVGGLLVGVFPMNHPVEHVAAATAFFELGWIFVALASASFLLVRDARFPARLAVLGSVAAALAIAFTVSLRVDDFSRRRMASEGPILGRPDVWVAPILEWAALIGIMAWVVLTAVAWSRRLGRAGEAG